MSFIYENIEKWLREEIMKSGDPWPFLGHIKDALQEIEKEMEEITVMESIMEESVEVTVEECEYETIDGKWWLFINGIASRPLTDDEAVSVIWDIPGSDEEGIAQ